MGQDEIVETDVVPIRHQLGRLLLGSAVAFLAGKVAESLYDTYVINRRNSED